MSRYAIFGARDPHAITPRFDPIDRERRIDPNAPVTAAYLGGRPVVFAQLDPSTRRPGEPAGLTVPLTVSRYQHAMDIERGYDPRGWEPTPLIGFGAPALQDIINCCPWRLPQPRGLTPYEWTVVERIIEGAIVSVRQTLFSAQTRAMARALTVALSTQNQAPGWKQSGFGPAPAVAAYQYGCLGAWWGALDYASQMRAIADMHSTDLLRRDQPPWSACPLAAIDTQWKAGVQSEYQIQKGHYGEPGTVADPCAWFRLRTAYLPVTGSEMIEIMKLVGGGVIDPQLQQMINIGGTLFAGRTFIVGFEFHQSPDYNKMPTSLSGMQDLLKVFDALLAEVALIWAPGQGMSIRNMVVTGKIDPAQLQQLMTALAPEAIDDLWKQLPNLLPGLLPLLGGSQPMNVTSRLDSAPRSFSDPSTPPTTGLKVVDEVGDAQDVTPPTEPPAAPATVGEGMDDPGIYLALAGVVLGGFLIWHGYKTR
jgi:hypothetical protein